MIYCRIIKAMSVKSIKLRIYICHLWSPSTGPQPSISTPQPRPQWANNWKWNSLEPIVCILSTFYPPCLLIYFRILDLSAGGLLTWTTWLEERKSAISLLSWNNLMVSTAVLFISTLSPNSRSSSSRHFSSPDFKLSKNASIPMKFCMRLQNHLPSNRFFHFFEFRPLKPPRGVFRGPPGGEGALKIELECWNFGCVLGPSFCMRGFLNFWNRGPLKPPGALKPPTVKFFIYWTILMKFEIQHFHMLTNNNWDRNL